jgi:predicted nucleotidyltransferase
MSENNLKLKTILKINSGSTLYNLRTTTSDTDYRGCVMSLNPEYLFGFRHFEQLEIKEPDTVMYNVPKFINLLFSGNTVALECLFAPNFHVIEEDDLGKFLRANALLFLSKRCFKVFGGYCKAEMHRALGETTGRLGEFRKAQTHRYGYALKNASHCMRLLYTALELFENQVYVVSWEEGDWRRNVMMALKNGQLKKEEFLHLYEEANLKFEKFKDNLWLPDSPNEKDILKEVSNYYLSIVKNL